MLTTETKCEGSPAMCPKASASGDGGDPIWIDAAAPMAGFIVIVLREGTEKRP